MNKNELQQKATILMASSEYKDIDVLILASDGKEFLDAEEAKKYAASLPEKSVTAFYRDDKVRSLARVNKELDRIVKATDYLKRFKTVRMDPPNYEQYLSDSEMSGESPVPEFLYKFINSKVFRKRPPMLTGQMDTIFTFDKGIVEATFIKRYPQGMVFVHQDDLIMTCPTNTQLAAGSFFHIFSPLLGKEPRIPKTETNDKIIKSDEKTTTQI